MEFQKNEKTVEQVGDIQNNNVSIDANNIDFIVTILSTNLYSKPVSSFIRETVSNAWDSHVEAKTDQPVVLSLFEDTEGNFFCKVQDFGVGLSPERFNNIYKNIGSSTKRSNNDQIGGFGIGRFSALAYSDVVYITSNYDGVKYFYMMMKDGTSISIDLINEMPTDEPNGVEVKVPVEAIDLSKFSDSIKDQLAFFENLYVTEELSESSNYWKTHIDDKYNSFQIKKYNNFSVNTLNPTKSISLLLGKVQYPLRLNALNKDYPAYVGRYPIALNMEIGDLQVTPNREEILYNPSNVAKIEKVLDLALEEVKVFIEDAKHINCNSLQDYILNVGIAGEAVLVEEDAENSKVSLRIPKEQMVITYKDKIYDEKVFKATYDKILNSAVISSNYSLKKGRIQYNTLYFRIKSLKDQPYKYRHANISTFKNETKKYIRENLGDTIFIPTQNWKKVAVKLLRTIKHSIGNSHHCDFDYRIFKVILGVISKGSKNLIETFDEDDVPNYWKVEQKEKALAARLARKKDEVNWKENINIYYPRISKRSAKGYTLDNKPCLLKDLNIKHKALTIYAPKGSEKTLSFHKLLNLSKTKVVEISPTKMKLVKHLSNFINIEDIMSSEYKIIRNLGTVALIEKRVPELDKLAYVKGLNEISEKLDFLVKEFRKFQQINVTLDSIATEEKLLEECYSICERDNMFDPQIKALLDANVDMLRHAQCILKFTHKTTYDVHYRFKGTKNICIDYILARKLFRPSIPGVVKLKLETIYNVQSKIEENENN